MLALLLAAPISVLAGMLGVGPGFLLLPTLILVGYKSKHAAAMNALAVTPPSFSALLPHIETAKVDFQLAILLLLVGAIGSFIGARITSLYVPGRRLKQIFGVLIVVPDCLQALSDRLLTEGRPQCPSKVVIHIFHADDNSLGPGAHVSERIRQVKQERGVALEVYVFGPAEKALADPARSEFLETLVKLAQAGVPIHLCRDIAEELG